MPAVYVGQHARRRLPWTRSLMVPSYSRMMCAALGLLLLACDSRVTPQREWRPGDHGQPTQVDPSRVPQAEAAPEEGGVERAASALWNVSCASCHGRDGRGQGPGRPPGAQIPDFTAAELQKTRTDAQLLQVIREGRGMMPGFAKQVNEQGLAALVSHIRSLGSTKTN
jgi:mono/diheme cytochrome c family protein